MHIVLANRWYPPHSGYGGVAMYNYYLAHALVNLGHRVTVVAGRWSMDAPALAQDGEVVVHRLLVHHYARLHRLPGIGRYIRALQQMQYSVQVARKLRELEATEPVDVIEFAEINAEGWAYLRQRERCPTVVRCHTPTFVLRNYYTTTEMPYDTRLTTYLEQFCIRHADTLTAPSQHMASTIAEACRLPIGEIHVIPNGLDVELFCSGDQDASTKDRSGDACVQVLHVGRLDRIKGIEVLAHAIPKVVAQTPNVLFIFIGEGSAWQQRLTDYFKEQCIEEKVRFLGGVDQATLLRWYKEVDIAVVPSLNYESFSYTCAQAMAAGLPVVASAIGGIPETIGNAGLMVSPGDVDALATALTHLASDPIRRQTLGLGAVQRVGTLFNANLIAERTSSLYQSIS